MIPSERVAASFRDPDGFVFRRNGAIFRQVNAGYVPTIERLLSTGFYNELVRNGQAIAIEPTNEQADGAAPGGIAFRAERIDSISYPFEWSFSQLKSAALLTLEIARLAVQSGFSLKDATAYNIQFKGTKPIFIDTLSFEDYEEGKPWIAYGQFCRHFLAPLTLMALVDVRLGDLLRRYIDGIPLDLASRLLPGSSKLKPGLLIHIHSHASMDKKSTGKSTHTASVSKAGVLGLLDSLASTIRNLNYEPSGTEWADYYDETNYSATATDSKHQLVAELARQISPRPKVAWDLGANDGTYARIIADLGIDVVAWDGDPAAVERASRVKHDRVLPLLQDFSNPSPDMGWLNRERDGLFGRGPVDLALALALVHHIAIGNNVPLPSLAEFLSKCATWALVEWVPKDDSQVQRLLAARKDIFDDYNEDGFVTAMSTQFEIVREVEIQGTLRKLFLFRRRS